jgi:diguanylate cyclase (GGDEF)-like protein/PAS domain S-box-containing protein
MSATDGHSKDPSIDAEVLHALLSEATVSVWVVDENETILFTNDAASTLTGYPRDELLHMRISDLMGEDIAAQHRGHIHRYLNRVGGESSTLGRTLEFDLVGRDGRTIPVELKAFDLHKRLAGRHLFGAVIADNRAHKAVEEEMRQLARLDHLTQCLNRLGFLDRAHQELSRARRLGHPLSLVVMDVDRFKQVNDHYGHQAGDRVLAELSRTVMRSLRSHDIFARVGGEEFHLMLPESDRKACMETAERLRASIAETTFGLNGASVRVTASFGCAQLRAADDLDALIRRADQRMYQAKNAGRDRVFPAHDGPEDSAGDEPAGKPA